MLKIKECEKYYIVLGAGGTGSWLAQFLSKIDVNVYLIDGDIVETKNIIRQNFSKKEVSINKAEIAKKWNFNYVPEYITDTSIIEEIIESEEGMPVLIGCLDNNASRKIAHDVFYNPKYKDILWLDAGNEERHGQTYVAAKYNNKIIYDSPIILDEAFQNFDGDERRPDQISCAEISESAPQNVTANITSATVLFNLINLIEESKILLGNKYNFQTSLCSITSEEIIKNDLQKDKKVLE